MKRTGPWVLLTILSASAVASAAPLQREAYWWLDELRSVAFAVSRARTGEVSCWPQLTVPAGSLRLPLPEVGERPSGAGWGSVTRFPVGPLFGPWETGPFTFQVSACRDAERAYLRLESPVDLTDLGSAAPAAELLSADRPYRVGDGLAPVDGGWEAVLPLMPGNTLTVTFPAELLRRTGGTVPAELAALGVAAHAAPVWLSPLVVELVPAETAAQLAVDDGALAYSLGGEAGRVQATPATGGVSTFRWDLAVGALAFHAEGFLYREPVSETLAAARAIAARSGVALAEAPTTGDRAAYRRARELRAQAQLSLLCAPLLFAKQHPYFAGHIYDSYYTWHPGGGVYVLDNPADLSGTPQVRAVVDADTPATLGGGVYRDPDLSWDASRLLFAYKPAPEQRTSLYEVALDGTGLRQLTDSEQYDDIGPAYLPDGRVVFTSTRPRALVPCFNSGVDTLHVMNADGSGLRSISSNNVTEFDPSVTEDGRVLYGRWEYVDKTALYMQSLWTALPDGTQEEALFANNLPMPTALLDARAVPGSRHVVASLTPHNGQAVGAIGMIDPQLGKNNLAAICNLTPEYPTRMDQGLTVGPCDPWPLSGQDVLIANNAVGGHGIIELIDQDGNRELVYTDPAISCYAPMPLAPRPRPPIIPDGGGGEEWGRFLVVDVYRGLTGVERGTVKRLRVLEETARTSGIPPGGRWWNQAFLVSWQGSYVVKSFLGTVPVHEDGSAYFEAPPGVALYLEALDGEGREVQRMRTMVQAASGTTRSCIGCHESKSDAPPAAGSIPLALRQPPARPEPEAWGSGHLDYPTMVQPVLDRHCVSCHGGEQGIDAGIDLSGGWTWAFNLSYETLLKHDLAGFMRCNNADVSSSDILPPRTIGSGASKLGGLLLSGHDGRLPSLTRAERDLLMAWMDGNSNYYGTWDYSEHATCEAILGAGERLAQQMGEMGCTSCHAPGHIGSDWVNLQRPEWSRILRAPLSAQAGGLALDWCRDRPARAGLPLVDQRYLPPDRFHPQPLLRLDLSGVPQPTFTSTDDPRYQSLLRTVRRAAVEALGAPRVDMPGARAVGGACRRQTLVPLPEAPPALTASVVADGAVELAWRPSSSTVGLAFELHRSPTADFAPSDATRLVDYAPLRFLDYGADEGAWHYALLAVSGQGRSAPSRASVTVPPLPPPEAPVGLAATPAPGEVALAWEPLPLPGMRYQVMRSRQGTEDWAALTDAPLAAASLSDGSAEPGVRYSYRVQAVDRRGRTGEPSASVVAAALPETREAVFTADFGSGPAAQLASGEEATGRLYGAAQVEAGALNLRSGGHVTYDHRPEFDLRSKLSVEFWAYLDDPGQMPVFVSCGSWPTVGWFMQKLGGAWRWHVGGVDCDGGAPAVGRWMHVVGTWDGLRSRVYQDGREVANVACRPNRTPWPGALHVGQYSAAPGPPYQVAGRLRGLRVYQRALAAEEVAKHSQVGVDAN